MAQLRQRNSTVRLVAPIPEKSELNVIVGLAVPLGPVNVTAPNSSPFVPRRRRRNMLPGGKANGVMSAPNSETPGIRITTPLELPTFSRVIATASCDTPPGSEPPARRFVTLTSV